jgi:hypothetical protein
MSPGASACSESTSSVGLKSKASIPLSGTAAFSPQPPHAGRVFIVDLIGDFAGALIGVGVVDREVVADEEDAPSLRTGPPAQPASSSPTITNPAPRMAER